MTQRTHYETLGLAPDATLDAIRQRYRELARRFHPDVAPDPDAAARFKEINEAHAVLSHPDKRASYDAELKLARLRAERAQHAPRGRSQAPPSGPAASDRAGRAPGAPRTPRAAPNRTGAPGGGPAHRPDTRRQRPVQPGIGVIDQLTNEAQRAVAHMRYREAEMICRYVLRNDARNPVAYEVLGDVHRARGRRDEALRMYSYAVQFNPRSAQVQAKYERMLGRTRAATDAVPASLRVRSARAGRALMGGVCLAGLAVLPFLVPQADAAPLGDVLWLRLSPEVLLALGGAGVLAGILLASAGIVGHARDELGVLRARRPDRITVPMGPVLLLLAVVWFPLAFLAYVVVGFAQGGLSRSLLRAFAATLAVLALFAASTPSAGLELLTWGGNAAFPALVAGWFVGDAVRQ